MQIHLLTALALHVQCPVLLAALFGIQHFQHALAQHLVVRMYGKVHVGLATLQLDHPRLVAITLLRQYLTQHVAAAWAQGALRMQAATKPGTNADLTVIAVMYNAETSLAVAA